MPRPKSAYKKNKKGLTPRQLLAINEYFTNGFVKKDALLAAGYSEKTANHNPHGVFENPPFKAEVDRRLALMQEEYEVTEEWLRKRYKFYAQAGEILAKYKVVTKDGKLDWDFTGATEEELSLVEELGVDFYTEGRGKNARNVKKFRIKAVDSIAALDRLARHIGFFNDKLEITGSLGERLAKGRERAYNRNKDRKPQAEDADERVPH